MRVGKTKTLHDDVKHVIDNLENYLMPKVRKGERRMVLDADIIAGEMHISSQKAKTIMKMVLKKLPEHEAEKIT